MLPPIFCVREIKEWVVLNGQHSSCANNIAGAFQGSILRLLFFLIYINDLTDDFNSNPKLFADGNSLFSVCSNNLNNEKWVGFSMENDIKSWP